ncbi:MAG: hypothetical protein MUP85_19240 [Candidatus Lokiarchaeota archaeon]|nr:hypothetical protein [Candidatus Lokiarchaeota archaeon]
MNSFKNETLNITYKDKTLKLFINDVSDYDFENLKKLFLSDNLKSLLFDVSSELDSDTIQFNISTKIDSHGAFDPNISIPTFILNSSTGLSSSNIAHELIHAIQIKEGYPTIKKIYKDKRNDVLRELGSNLLHVPLAKILQSRGFKIEKYLAPTLMKTRNVLISRGEFDETKMIFYRAHYEAVFYLRIYFEANYLDNDQKIFYENLFKEKAPIALSLSKELISAITRYKLEDPVDYTKALYDCIKLLNDKDLSKYYKNYFPNCYADYLAYMKYTYEYLM